MWFATERGISRFNGYEFESILEKESPSYSPVYIIKEDEQGRLWFAGKDRSIYRYQQGDLMRYPSINDPKSGIIISMEIGENDTVFAGVKTAINPFLKISQEGTKEYFRMHQNSRQMLPAKYIGFSWNYRDSLQAIIEKKLQERYNKKFEYFSFREKTDNLVFFLCQNSDNKIVQGEYLLGGEARILEQGSLNFDQSTDLDEPIHIWMDDQHPLLFSRGHVFSRVKNNQVRLQINDHVLYIARDEYPRIEFEVLGDKPTDLLLALNKSLIRIKDYEVDWEIPLEAYVSQCLVKDRSGAIWVGHMKNGGVTKLVVDEAGNYSSKRFLEGYSVTSVCEDHEGGFWFTTYEEGIFYLPNPHVKSYRTDQSGYSKISGTSEMVILYEASQQFPPIYLGPGQESDFKKFPGPLFHYRSYGWLQQVGQNGLVVLSNRIDYKPSLSEPVYTLSEVTSVRGCQFAITVGDSLLIGQTNHAMEIYSMKSKKLIQTVPYLNNPMFHQFNFTGHHGTKMGDTIWLATSYGIYRFNVRSGRFYDLDVDHPALKKSIDQVFATSGKLIFRNTSGEVWIKQGKNLELLQQQSFLKAISFNHLFLQPNGTLWAATNRGLFQFKDLSKPTRDWTKRKFDASHGLLSQDVLQVFAHENTAWALSLIGVTALDLNLLKLNEAPPQIELRHALINDSDTLKGSDVELPSDQNNLVFSFLGLAYKNRGKVHYRYKLEGLQDQWQHDDSRSVRYSYLPAGTYRFVVQASNNDGVWSTTAASIRFSINPPLWMSWWFYASMAILIGGVVYLMVRIRIDRIQRETELRQVALEAKQGALRAQMTPHFIFNSLNSIQQLVTRNERLPAMKSMTRFAKLMRRILNNSRESHISLENEIETLTLYLELEQLRFRNKFEFEIMEIGNIDSSFIQIPPMLIQPYIENAIWHGIMNKPDQSGKVTISIEEQGDYLICNVEDDGIGRVAARERQSQFGDKHQSFGRTITEERLKILSQSPGSENHTTVKTTDLYDEDGHALGTRVTLNIQITI